MQEFHLFRNITFSFRTATPTHGLTGIDMIYSKWRFWTGQAWQLLEYWLSLIICWKQVSSWLIDCCIDLIDWSIDQSIYLLTDWLDRILHPQPCRTILAEWDTRVIEWDMFFMTLSLGDKDITRPCISQWSRYSCVSVYCIFVLFIMHRWSRYK